MTENKANIDDFTIKNLDDEIQATKKKIVLFATVFLVAVPTIMAACILYFVNRSAVKFQIKISL